MAIDDDTGREVRDYEHSSFDALRVVVATAATGVITLVTRYLGSGAEGFEAQLSQLLSAPVGWVQAAVDVMLVATVLLSVIAVLLIPLVARRLRQIGYVVAAMVLGGIVIAVLGDWIGLRVVHVGPDPTTEALARTFALDVAATAQLVATFVVTAPFVGTRWRRLGVGIVAAVFVMQLAVVSGEATHALLALSAGYAVGSAVLVLFGRPTRTPRPADIIAALHAGGADVDVLTAVGPGPHGTATFHADAEGRCGSDTPQIGRDRSDARLFVQVLGTDQLAADLMRRAYRAVRFRDPGDDRPFTSVRRSVEHEALVSYQARDVGVRTPRLRSLAAVGDDSFLIAFDRIDGVTLDCLEQDRRTDDLLRELWRQIRVLREHRIAHRDLRPANVLVDDDDRPWIVGLWRAEIASSDAQLRADLAQALTALSLEVGVDRSVATAVEVLGADVVASALGRLQAIVLSRGTRRRVRERPELLDDLRAEIERRCGVDAAPLEPITRLGPRQLFTVVMLVAVVYFLVPQFADLPGIVEQVRDANWIWAIPAVLASIGTYLAASVALIGVTPGSLPYWRTAAAQLATAFTSTVAPAGTGSMALNVRYLQRQGVDGAVATSSVGLMVVDGLVGHVALIAIFLVWAGRQAFGPVELPSPRALLIGVGVVVVIAAATLLVPSTRQMVRTRLLPTLARAAGGLAEVLTTPSKVALMLTGSTLTTFSYLLAFAASAEAFDIRIKFATLGAVYLVGSAIATIAPTPGGIGATEAALIGSLVAVGIDNQQAVPAVFFFRLITFWIPILPGWISFTWLRRTDRL
ncbi:MAG: flippase-like domain-containing protein [Actinobacteria bacterium]|nr:flippase-like domain-containing protein [Actinomycetota bacterium]